MPWFLKLSIAERTLPFVLFTLYVITAVRPCRYSSWRSEGAPNPFLPRRIKALLRRHAKRQMSRGQMPAFA